MEKEMGLGSFCDFIPDRRRVKQDVLETRKYD